MSQILIIVDMQVDFVTGSLANPAAQAIVPNIIKEIESGKYDEILFTQDTHYTDYLQTSEGKKLPVEHCKFETTGWEIIPELRKYVTKILYKYTFGCNFKERFIWKPTDAITLVGTCTDICVVSNALILKSTYPETPIRVLANCCAGVTPEKHEAALEVMRSCQIDVE